MSSGSCSTQPSLRVVLLDLLLGGAERRRTCAASYTTARELVVPWSMARITGGAHGFTSAEGKGDQKSLALRTWYQRVRVRDWWNLLLDSQQCPS